MTLKNKNYLPYITVAILLALTCLIILVVNISQPHKTNSREFTDSATGFSITPPKGWHQPKSTPKGLLVEFEATDAKAPKPTLSVIGSPARATLDQYIKSISFNNSKEFNDYKEIGGQKIIVDGAKGAILEYSAKVDGYDLRYSELVAIKHAAFYQVTGTTTASSWNSYRNAIEASLKSVKLK